MRQSPSEAAWVNVALRTVGLGCAALAGLSGISVFAGMLIGLDGFVKWAGFVFIASVIVPYATMQVHFAATRTLTEREKASWERGMWGLSGFLAAFFYLTRSDRRLK
jgi:hypothetical protein